MDNYETLQDLLGIQMSKTMLAMKRHVLAEFEKVKSEMSFDDWMNLLPVVEKTPLTQKDLAHILGKDKTTISRLINHWEKSGFVERIKSDQDQRVKFVQMTPHAKSLHRKLRPLFDKADKVFRQSLSLQDFEHLQKSLVKIRQGLQKSPAKRPNE